MIILLAEEHKLSFYSKEVLMTSKIYEGCPNKEECIRKGAKFVLECYEIFGQFTAGIEGAKADCAAGRKLALGLKNPIKADTVPDGLCARNYGV